MFGSFKNYFYLCTRLNLRQCFFFPLMGISEAAFMWPQFFFRIVSSENGRRPVEVRQTSKQQQKNKIIRLWQVK